MLDRKTDRYSSDKARSESSARQTLGFVYAQRDFLKDKHKEAAISMYRQDTELTPNQKNYVDGLYEMIMKELTGEYVDRHIDKKRRRIV